jgi:hypothetical protein
MSHAITRENYNTERSEKSSKLFFSLLGKKEEKEWDLRKFTHRIY